MLVQSNSHRLQDDHHPDAPNLPASGSAGAESTPPNLDEIYEAQARLHRSSPLGVTPERDVQRQFEQRFASSARDPARFDALMAAGFSAVGGLGLSAWEGVNSLAHSVWDGASNLLSRARNGVSTGLGSAYDWLTHRLDDVGRGLSAVRRASGEEVARWAGAAKNLALGMKDAAVGFGKNFIEAGEHLGRSFERAWRGDFAAAGEEFGKGLLCVPQAYADFALMAGGKAISAVQTVAHLEPVARALSDSEIAELRKAFGDDIDYSAVEVKVGSAGLLTMFGRPFVLGNTLYMPNEAFTPAELAHEVTHVWQHQHGGTDYLSEALIPRYITGTEATAYDWGRSVPGTPFNELDPEQQSGFIEAAQKAGAFEAVPPAFGHKPDGYTGSLAELNAYLAASLDAIRERNCIT